MKRRRGGIAIFPIVGILCAVASLSSAALLSGCGEKEPIKIGFVGGLSGRVADLGISGRNGALLAVEMKNLGGGVKGRPVELIVRDDGQNVETALRVDRELVDLGVEAVIGHMTSSMSKVAVPIMNESRTTMVSPTTTTTYLSGMDDHFLRISATTRKYASRMARYLWEKAGVEDVSIVYDLGNQAYTESWYKDFREEFAGLGGLVSEVVTFRSGPEVHFYDLARKALDKETDGLVIIASAMDAAMLGQQVKKLGRNVTLIGSEWASTEKFIDFGGAAVEGAILSQFFDRDSTAPAYVSFRKAYRERFGDGPGFVAVNAFDAATVVLEALERSKRRETLKETILRIAQFDGLQGTVRIDRFGDADRRTFITIVQNGRFRVVE